MVGSAPIRVVLADDHAVVRAGIRQFLEQADDIAVVAEADDGGMACELIERYRPDVAVLDIEMPHATGIEVARWAREHAPDVGILILTAYDDDPYVRAVVQAGASGYLLKTAAPVVLIDAVRSVNAGRPALDAAAVGRLVAQLSGSVRDEVYERLSDREMEVLSLVGQGLTNREIGQRLGISSRTVQGHLLKINQKLRAPSRTAAVMRAVALGWLPRDLARAGEP